jgi:hypothetical protein
MPWIRAPFVRIQLTMIYKYEYNKLHTIKRLWMVLRAEIRNYNTLCLRNLFLMQFINTLSWNYSFLSSLPTEFCTHGMNWQHALLSQYMRICEPPLWSSGQSFWLQIQRSRVRFPVLPDFLSSNRSGTGSTQPREVNSWATWTKK